MQNGLPKVIIVTKAGYMICNYYADNNSAYRAFNTAISDDPSIVYAAMWEAGGTEPYNQFCPFK